MNNLNSKILSNVSKLFETASSSSESSFKKGYSQCNEDNSQNYGVVEFEGFVSSVEVGDKVFYHNKKTDETIECTVEYIYINYKNTPYNGVIEIFLKDEQHDEVIRLTVEDAEADTFELLYDAE